MDLNLKSYFQIASLFHMYIDMGERIDGEQDRPSLIVECPPPHRTHQIANNIRFFTFWTIYEKKLVFYCFPFCAYVSSVMRSVFSDILVPRYPWILYSGLAGPPPPPQYFVSYFFYFNSKCYYHIVSLFDM